VTWRRQKLEKSCTAREEILRKKVGPITVDTGKGLKGDRMAEWPVVAMKESNVSGAKGPC
jgi:hypothetical protein